MQPYDLTIPILPSREVNQTVAFYKRLGLDEAFNQAAAARGNRFDGKLKIG